MTHHALRRLFALVVFGLPVAAAAQSPNPLTTGALPVPANRIVGLWDTRVHVAPCGTTPPAQGFPALNLFHAGGTISASNNFPPTSVGPSYGTWVYDRHSRSYRAQMQFYWFTPTGQYDGYQHVRRDITLSADHNGMDETVHSVRYAASGAALAELCGYATANRVE